MNRTNQVSIQYSAYRTEIDGLRAFSVLSVVLFHAYPSLIPGGFIGVDVFFVISGFLITGHIFEKLNNDSFSFSDFFSRRIRRILPALILVLFSCLLFGWLALLAVEYSQLGKHVASSAVFALNFFLVGESSYFDNAAETKPLLHLWTIAVEEQFYIIWPLILWMAWRIKLSLFIITVVIGIFSLFWNLTFVETRPVEAYFLPFGRFWVLLSGSVLAWLALYRKDVFRRIVVGVDKHILSAVNSKKSADGAITTNLAAVIGTLILFYGVIYINKDFDYPGSWALMPTIGAVLVISAGSRSFVNRIIFMNPVAIWIGLISYPLYLWHWPILSFPRIILGEDLSGNLIILCLVLAAVASVLTYLFLEIPIRKRKPSAKMSLILLTLLGSAGCFGLYVFMSNGLPLRDVNNMENQISRIEYFRYLDDNYVDCMPNEIRENAII